MSQEISPCLLGPSQDPAGDTTGASPSPPLLSLCKVRLVRSSAWGPPITSTHLETNSRLSRPQVGCPPPLAPSCHLRPPLPPASHTGPCTFSRHPSPSPIQALPGILWGNPPHQGFTGLTPSRAPPRRGFPCPPRGDSSPPPTGTGQQLPRYPATPTVCRVPFSPHLSMSRRMSGSWQPQFL